MKTNLKKIIKTKKPIGKLISNLLRDKVKSENKMEILSPREEIPTTETNSPINNLHDNVNLKKNTEEDVNYIKRLEETIKTIITNNKNNFYFSLLCKKETIFLFISWMRTNGWHRRTFYS